MTKRQRTFKVGSREIHVSEDDFPSLEFPGEEDIQNVFQRIYSEPDDRIAAILGCSVIEHRLRQTLRNTLARWDSELFGKGAKPGEFGLREMYKLAYCLGVIGDDAKHDIKIVGQVRNLFAHNFGHLTFDGENRIKQRCLELKTPEIVGAIIDLSIPTGSRERFAFSVMWIQTMLLFSTQHQPKRTFNW